MIFTACAICNRSFTRDSPRWCCAVCDTRICIVSALNLAVTLGDMARFAEARQILGEAIPKARKKMGDDHDLTLCLRYNYVCSLVNDDTSSLSDLREAVAMMEDAERRARRVYGADHPQAVSKTVMLRKARQKLVNAERTGAIANVDRLRDELAAAEAALAALRTS